MKTELQTAVTAIQGAELQDPSAAVDYFLRDQTNIKDSTRTTYRRALLRFFAYLRATGRLTAPTRQDVVAYKKQLLHNVERSRLSSLTACSYINAVRVFFAWAEVTELYPNITKGVKIPKHTAAHRKQHLTVEKVREMLQHYTAEADYKGNCLRDYAIVNLMIFTGLRTAELTGANVNDISFRGGERVLYIKGKGHTDKDDYVPLPARVYEPIRNYLSTRVYRSGDPLFVSDSNHHAKEDDGRTDRLTTRTIRNIVKDGLKAINLDGKEYTAHSLRHTTAVLLLEAGGVVDDVFVQLRHMNIATSLVYVQSYNRDKQLKRISELLDSIV